MEELPDYFADDAAIDLIAELVELIKDQPELQVIARLRKTHNPELVRFLVTQAKLRLRSVAKIGSDASGMLFTEVGLEQATRAPIAKWHAKLLVQQGFKSVTDLGCGIGLDSKAFAMEGLRVLAIDNNPSAVLAAKHNLKKFPLAKVDFADAESLMLSTDAAYLDPARRDQDRKGLKTQRLEPQDFSPSLDFAFQVAKQLPALIKLSPSFPHELIPSDFEANWVSNQGDLVELLLKSGSLAEAGKRSAVIVGDEILEFQGDQIQGQVVPLAKYIFEPDNALVRSHLVGDFARNNKLGLISEGIAYLTSNTDLASPWLKRYRVIELLPLKEKEIRNYCQRHGIGILEIKKRGVDITAEELRPKLKLKGTSAATLVLTKVGGARQAIVCEPIR